MRGSMRSRSCLLFYLLAVNVGTGCSAEASREFDVGDPSAR